MPNQDNWKLYYEKTSGKPPRETLTRALDRLKNEEIVGKAFDIGSGTCNDVKYLLEQGWKVVAVDNEPEAQAYFVQEFSGKPSASFQLASFERIKWEAVELVHAGFALAFCPKEHFQQVMQNIKAAIKKNGRFAGNFFGTAHTWNDLHLVTTAEVKELFKDFELEYFEESKLTRKSTFDEEIFHHNISIVAKKL
jgi:tellurite methyltransferase